MVARSSQETKFFNEVKQLLEMGGNADFQLLDNDATLVSNPAYFESIYNYCIAKFCYLIKWRNNKTCLTVSLASVTRGSC